jgi:hypothetical protein
MLLEAGGAGTQPVLDSWQKIMQAPEVIAAAVQLPGIGVDVTKGLKTKVNG